jgi:hypothetical protein
MLERAVLLALLGLGPGERTTPEQLAAQLLDAEPAQLRALIERLARASVVCVQDEEVWASAAARRIDELGLIAI